MRESTRGGHDGVCAVRHLVDLRRLGPIGWPPNS
jgi:hypothetical protein